MLMQGTGLASRGAGGFSKMPPSTLFTQQQQWQQLKHQNCDELDGLCLFFGTFWIVVSLYVCIYPPLLAISHTSSGGVKGGATCACAHTNAASCTARPSHTDGQQSIDVITLLLINTDINFCIDTWIHAATTFGDLASHTH